MVVGAGDDPSIGEYERMLISAKTTARKELVLLHPERSVVPGSTREWLKVTTTLSLYSFIYFNDLVDPPLGQSTFPCRITSEHHYVRIRSTGS